MKTFCLRLIVPLVLALPAAAWAQRGGDAVYMEDRLNQIQQSLTTLTGQLEQMQYRNQQLQQQMEKMQADYEYRLDTLEKGGRAGPRPATAPTSTASAPPLPAGSGNLAANAPPSSGGGLQGEAVYHDAFKHLQDGDYAGAEQGFKAFVQRNPQHVLAGNAQYWLGETYYARRDYQNAMTAFAEGYKIYKASPNGPDNLLKLGITLAVMNRKPDACAVFASFNQDYPRATDLQKRRIDQERQKTGCS